MDLAANAEPVVLDVGDLRSSHREAKARLLEKLKAPSFNTRGIMATLRELASVTDKTLRNLWQRAGLPNGFALVAVGGYGRGELFPYSDVDVLVLMPDGTSLDDGSPTANAIKPRLEAFIGACWDLGLDIGSSVRTAAECLDEASRDITIQTALVERRLIAGSKAAFQDVSARLDKAMDPKAFFTAKMLEMRQRHNKYENTAYALEPNCKESPGGLRDLQIILWVARAAGLGHSWDDLERHDVANAREVRQARANEAMLSLIRARLHVTAGRREDRLVFDLQTALAEALGLKATPVKGGRATSRGARRASELLMKRYYWAAKAVRQLSRILLLNIEDAIYADTDALSEPTGKLRPLNERFFEKAGMLEVSSDDLYERHPHAILETFHLYQTTLGIKGLSARTLRALYNARPLMNAAFRADPVNRAMFMRILREPEGITHAFRLMNQTSVLGRYLWAFRNTVGQMQHDLFHVYTVDQHILMVLRNVRRFFIAEHSHEYPFCSQLAAGWDKPWILYAAALFHDIGKGRGGDHSEIGAREVRSFCRQHGVAKEDAQLIEFLVAEHLTMSHVAQKQDLSDPDVIESFARRIGSERKLTGLYLLTVADIRGTSPKVWNGWKAKLLEDLYKYSLRVLGGGAPDPMAMVEGRKIEAITRLALHSLPARAHEALWDTLDVSYFMRHPADDIAWHTRVLSKELSRRAAEKSTRENTTAEVAQAIHDGDSPPIVSARPSPDGDGLQVLVYSCDKPELFARICNYFDRSDFCIIDARIHTTKDGNALDSFEIVAPDLEEHYRSLVTMVEKDLYDSLKDTGQLPNPVKGRLSRRVKSFPVTPRVDLRPDEKGQRWVLSISASDRAGLLYSIARVMANHEISVELAKISTLGERAEDTFLVSGRSLQVNKQQIAFETELLEAIKD